MHSFTASAVLLGIALGSPAPARAQQRFPFERSFKTDGISAVDIRTERGKIDVRAGEPGGIVVTGTVTVRLGLDVPLAAIEIARRIAANPPIAIEGATLRLRPPAEAVERRAVTVSYEIRVPPATPIASQTDSGATAIAGIAGPVSVRTQSSAIDLTRLAGKADVTTGSGAVTVDGIAGALSVTTSSSGFKGYSLGGALTVRTRSGAVEAFLTGPGDVDVRTGSSAIQLRGVAGGLLARSDSGRVSIHGAPGKPWETTTGSSGVEIVLPPRASFTVDAMTGSGSVRVASAVDGTVEKRRVSGSVGGGGPLVRVESRSGSIAIGSGNSGR